MSDLPQVRGSRVVRALKRLGFEVLRQTGSHVMLRHRTDTARRAVVAVHGSKPIPPGTLRAILRGAGLKVSDLKEHL